MIDTTYDQLTSTPGTVHKFSLGKYSPRAMLNVRSVLSHCAASNQYRVYAPGRTMYVFVKQLPNESVNELIMYMAILVGGAFLETEKVCAMQ